MNKQLRIVLFNHQKKKEIRLRQKKLRWFFFFFISGKEWSFHILEACEVGMGPQRQFVITHPHVQQSQTLSYKHLHQRESGSTERTGTRWASTPRWRRKLVFGKNPVCSLRSNTNLSQGNCVFCCCCFFFRENSTQFAAAEERCILFDAETG